MRKPFIPVSGICISLLLLVTITHSLDHEHRQDTIEDNNSNWFSPTDVLHRVKRQFDWFWGKKTTTEKPATDSGDRNGRDSGDFSGERSQSVTPNLLGQTTDDEDLGTSSGSGEERPIVTYSDPDVDKPRYYRISMIVHEPWNPKYEDASSPVFRMLAELLTTSINQLYDDVEGRQTTRVIKIQKVETLKIRVFLDLETVGNHDTNQIKNRLKRQIDGYQRIGNYVVEKDIIFNEFGACENDEISCKDGAQCVPQNARCDRNVDCADGSDEVGCDNPEPTEEVYIPGKEDKEEEDEEEVAPRSRHRGSGREPNYGQQSGGDNEGQVEEDPTSFEEDRTTERSRVVTGGWSQGNRSWSWESGNWTNTWTAESGSGVSIDTTLGSGGIVGSFGNRLPGVTIEDSLGYGRGDDARSSEIYGSVKGSSGRDRYDDSRGDSGRQDGSRDRYDDSREDSGRQDGSRDRYDDSRGDSGGYDGASRGASGRQDGYRDRYDDSRGDSGRYDGSRDSSRYDSSRTTSSRFDQNEVSWENRFESSSGRDDRREDNYDRYDSRTTSSGIISTSYGTTGTTPSTRPDILTTWMEEADRRRPDSASQGRDQPGRDACRADDKVRCSSDRSIYICNDQECDGHPDCPGGSDEENCPKERECGQGEFMCDVTRCIIGSKKCDGTRDCQDGTDENECPIQGCDFKCRDGTCLSYPQRCNIVKDCPGGEDEMGCPSNTTENVQKHAYPTTEHDYHTTEHAFTTNAYHSWNCSYSTEFKCKSGHCLHEIYRCNGMPDCPDGDDEEFCCKSRFS